MKKQVYVVTLEVPPPFDRYFPEVEAERMADAIRDGVQAKSCSFMGPVLFKVTVAKADGVASANGEVPRYVPGESDEAPKQPVASLTVGTRRSDKARQNGGNA